MLANARYTEALRNLEASHERKKNIARMQLEVAIQTQVALFESDWEAQWVRKVTALSLNAIISQVRYVRQSRKRIIGDKCNRVG